MSEQPFILLIRARIKKEYLRQVEDAASRTLALTVQEPGCIAFHQTASAEDPCHFCFFEYFASRSAHAEHMDQAYTKAFSEFLDGKLEGPPVIQQLNMLNSSEVAE